MRGYSAERYEALFTEPSDVDVRMRPGVIAQRVKSVWHGPMLTVHGFPVWATRAEEGRARAARTGKGTSAAQRRINHRNAQDRVVQLANCNFGPGDVMATCTFAPGRGPGDDEDALRLFRNWIGRLRTLWRREGKAEPLKYIATIEKSASGREASGARYHIHALLNAAGIDRDRLEAAWGLGTSNTERYQHQEAYFSGFAGYMAVWKDGQRKATRKQYITSKGLKKPRETRSDHRLSVRRTERLAQAMDEEGRAILEAAYPGYRVVGDIVIRRSAFVAGAYFYANLRRIEGTPKGREGGRQGGTRRCG